jgi:hypothetical protein
LTGDRAASGTCVVHLVWAPLGVQLFARFLESYRRHQAGSPHRLVVLLNGFTPGQDIGPWRGLLTDIEHDELRLERPVLDLAAYREAAHGVAAERYCFLNSHCVLLADGWLASLENAILSHNAGLVGPSGSWGSISSYNRFMLGFGGHYAGVFSDRRATLATLAEVAARNDPSSDDGGRAPLRFARELLARSHGFRAFPSPHIRTSAFMVDARAFGGLKMPAFRAKADALRLESGRHSITAQIQSQGLDPLVVGRDGVVYASQDWASSRTFWQADQENLLIADKQTTDYELASMSARTALSRYAWGAAADPRPARSATPADPPR